jgi:hypothetical protein
MKKIKNFAGMMAIVFGVFTMNACNPCRNVDCGTNGECDEGVCICDAGYEGDACATETRTKFLGTYSVSETCGGATDTYSSNITTSTTSVTAVRISNFWGAFANLVNATVEGNALTIPSQQPDNDGFSVSGTGTISGNTLTITYTVAGGGGTQSCTATYTK